MNNTTMNGYKLFDILLSLFTDIYYNCNTERDRRGLISFNKTNVINNNVMRIYVIQNKFQIFSRVTLIYFNNQFIAIIILCLKRVTENRCKVKYQYIYKIIVIKMIRKMVFTDINIICIEDDILIRLINNYIIEDYIHNCTKGLKRIIFKASSLIHEAFHDLISIKIES